MRILSSFIFLFCLQIQAAEISVSPSKTFVLTVDRSFYAYNINEVITYSRPSTQFKINYDNTMSNNDILVTNYILNLEYNGEKSTIDFSDFRSSVTIDTKANLEVETFHKILKAKASGTLGGDDLFFIVDNLSYSVFNNSLVYNTDFSSGITGSVTLFGYYMDSNRQPIGNFTATTPNFLLQSY